MTSTHDRAATMYCFEGAAWLSKKCLLDLDERFRVVPCVGLVEENKKFALYAGKRVAWGKFLPTSVESVPYDVNPQNEKKTVAFINGMEFNMDGWVGFNK